MGEEARTLIASTKEKLMVRRDFLKLSGLVTAALLVQATPAVAAAAKLPVQVEAGGRLYRGSDDGRIYTSVNSGKSWQLHTDFGPNLSVWGLSADARGGVHTQLGFAGYGFHLSLMQDGKTWQTVQAPLVL